MTFLRLKRYALQNDDHILELHFSPSVLCPWTGDKGMKATNSVAGDAFARLAPTFPK
jgi:hypothetical protein